MDLVRTLEAGRRDFLDAIEGVSPEAGSVQPAPGVWSVLECIEHVVTVEGRYIKWIEEAESIAPSPDPGREMRLFLTIRSRSTRVETPDVFWPEGRFRTLAAAVAEFNAVRNRSVELVGEQAARLYSSGTRHPYFGHVNGVELVQLMDGHARRHADQIRETADAPRVR